MSLHSNKRKHTLDSDEEDDVDEVKTMKIEDIEGQEEGTIDFEGGIRFTPFHMKNELEEGTFDEHGMYLFKKNKDEIRDEWIDGVNWIQVKEMEKIGILKEQKEATLSYEKAKEEAEDVDEVTLMKSVLAIVLPKESVARAIKRLDKSGGTTGAWQKKKQKVEQTAEEAENSEKSKQQLSDLITYADKLLGKGMFNIYQETYESLSFKLSEKVTIATDDVDIFGSEDPKPVVPKPVPQENISDDISWYFKWTNEENAEVHGPYSSQQMLQWQEDDYFKDGVFVKKSSEENREFYSSRRIDFELYL